MIAAGAGIDGRPSERSMLKRFTLALIAFVGLIVPGVFCSCLWRRPRAKCRGSQRVAIGIWRHRRYSTGWCGNVLHRN